LGTLKSLTQGGSAFEAASMYGYNPYGSRDALPPKKQLKDKSVEITGSSPLSVKLSASIGAVFEIK